MIFNEITTTTNTTVCKRSLFFVSGVQKGCIAFVVLSVILILVVLRLWCMFFLCFLYRPYSGTSRQLIFGSYLCVSYLCCGQIVRTVRHVAHDETGRVSRECGCCVFEAPSQAHPLIQTHCETCCAFLLCWFFLLLLTHRNHHLLGLACFYWHRSWCFGKQTYHTKNSGKHLTGVSTVDAVSDTALVLLPTPERYRTVGAKI